VRSYIHVGMAAAFVLIGKLNTVVIGTRRIGPCVNYNSFHLIAKYIYDIPKYCPVGIKVGT
jgi:hypothetical protein